MVLLWRALSFFFRERRPCWYEDSCTASIFCICRREFSRSWVEVHSWDKRMSLLVLPGTDLPPLWYYNDSTMNSELRNTRPTATKRGNSATIRSDYETEHDRFPEERHNRVLDYQRVPSSVPVESSPVKRPRPLPSSSNSSSSSKTAHRKNSRASGKTHNSMTNNKLKMAELLSIKRELTVIKVQIDGLLDCVDKMDRQRKDCTECPRSREPSVVDSPHRGSVSSLDRDSPEPGEASEEEPVYYQNYYPHSYTHRIHQHSSDPEDNL